MTIFIMLQLSAGYIKRQHHNVSCKSKRSMKEAHYTREIYSSSFISRFSLLSGISTIHSLYLKNPPVLKVKVFSRFLLENQETTKAFTEILVAVQGE